MDDIVERLREEEAIESNKIRNGTWDGSPLHIVLSDAADTIERLQKELREAREVMEFYADKDGWTQPPVRTREGLLTIEYENQASKIQRDRGAMARAFLAKSQ